MLSCLVVPFVMLVTVACLATRSVNVLVEVIAMAAAVANPVAATTIDTVTRQLMDAIKRAVGWERLSRDMPGFSLPRGALPEWKTPAGAHLFPAIWAKAHAAGGIRTHTSLRTMDFESIVSTVPPPPRTCECTRALRPQRGYESAPSDAARTPRPSAAAA